MPPSHPPKIARRGESEATFSPPVKRERKIIRILKEAIRRGANAAVNVLFVPYEAAVRVNLSLMSADCGSGETERTRP